VCRFNLQFDVASRMNDQENDALLQRAVQGNGDAMRCLLERVGSQIWNEINSNISPALRSVLDADDVMQVTYMEAFLEVTRLSARDMPGFQAWLRRIAVNNLRDAVRELQRKRRLDPVRRVQAPPGEDSYVALVDLLGATSATPSRDAAQREAGQLIETVLQRLPPDYGTVVRLYDLEGHEISEVCRRMSRTAGAVHMLRARAHDRLRELLGEADRFFSAGA
jgi:RNA polymerase sigma-70 factor (ECF subfamily)